MGGYSPQELRERDLGVLEALTTDEMLEREAETYRSFRNDGPNTPPPGGESFKQFCERYAEGGGGNCPLSSWSENRDRNSRRCTGSALSLRMNVPLEKERNFVLLNCSLNRIDKKDNVWNLVSWGDIAHLEGMDCLDDA